MIQTSADYKRIRALSGSYYEVNVVVKQTGAADVVYGMDTLKTCKITQGLFSRNPPTMGGTVSAQCSLTLLEDKENWPRGGAFDVRVRVWDEDGTEYSEWITLGRFYTDTRVQNGSTLEIYGLDAMVQTEQSWTDKVEELPTQWPITAKAAVDLICEALDFELSADTELDDQNRFVGLKTAVTDADVTEPIDDTFTARDTLSSIAAAMGANWHITPDGKLRLIPFNSGGIVPGSAAIAGIAIAGITIVGTELPSATSSESEPEYVYVGPDKFANMTTGVPLPPVSGVELTALDGTVAVSGEEYRIKAVCDFSNSEASALALSKLGGYVYRPFSVTRCVLDPCVEVGDSAIIEGVTYQIVSAVWTLGKNVFCSFEAPFDAEQEHEYSVQSDTTKALLQTERVEAQLQSIITQSAGEIMATVSEVYVSKQSASDTYETKTHATDTYETKTDADTAYTTLSGSITINSDKIALVVEQVTDPETGTSYNRVDSASIVAAINNGESTIRIQADKVNLSGYVTISSLGAGGSTIVDGSRIKTGTLDAKAIKAGTLSADYISGGTINASNITVKNLNASNINSGSLAAAYIGNLGAGKITSGSFATDRIPSLNCDKINAGTFSADRIPNLNASKITAGTIDASKIEVKNLDASKISTGSLSATRISGGTLDCKYITVSNLSADSITSGTLDASDVTITNLTVTNLRFPSRSSYFAGKTFLFADGSNKYVYIGSDASTYNVDRIYMHTQNGITIRQRGNDSYALFINVSARSITPSVANCWDIGTSSAYMHNIYCNSVDAGGLYANFVAPTSTSNGLKIGRSGDKVGFFGTTPQTKKSVSGSTTDAKVTNLLTALRGYGLIS